MNADVLNGYAPLQFRDGQILVTGGAMDNTTFMPMTTQAVSEGNNQKVFCKLTLRDPWLKKAIFGNKHRVSACGLRLFVDLHKIVTHIWNGWPVCAAAAVTEAAAVTDDPTNDVAGGDDDGRPEKRRRRSIWVERRTRANPCKGKVFKCNCSSLCPEAYPGNKETRCISLLILDHQTVWLSIDDVDWAIKYLYAQYMLKNVAVVLPSDTGPSGAPPAAGNPTEASEPAGAGAAAAEPAAAGVAAAEPGAAKADAAGACTETEKEDDAVPPP